MSELGDMISVLEHRNDLMMQVAEEYTNYVNRREYWLTSGHVDATERIDLERVEFVMKVGQLVLQLHNS